MVYSEAANIWVDIYLMSGTAASSASAYSATITDTRDWMSFVDDLGAVGKQLLDDGEFQAIAAGGNEETNIAGSADPVTTGGHSDTVGRRMISNVGVEDAAGAMYQWLRDQSYRFDGGSIGMVAAAETTAVTYDATPGGNQIYLCYDAAGVPYLACNMANDTADKVLTFGTNYKVVVQHEASPSGVALYFDDNATQPGRLLTNNTVTGKNEHIRTNDPEHFVRIVHDADAATTGAELNFDDGADERLECACAGEANADFDLAELAFAGPSWGYYDLPGAKGSFYRQGSYGTVCLRAGGYWDAGADCGSRCRTAYSYRWYTHSSIGGRGRAEPL